MKRVLVAGLVIFTSGAFSVRSQDTATPPPDSSNAEALPSQSPQDISRAIAEKQAEIDRLKAQLEQAKSEISDLHQQNSQLKTSDTALQSKVEASAPALLRPAPPTLAAAPTSATPVNSIDLFWYYKNSPDQARSYLTDKQIRVSGKVTGFDPPLVSRTFGIQLDSGDPNLHVSCRFSIPANYTGVVFHRQTGTIEGVNAGGGRDPLLQIGDAVIVEGHCRGQDGGDVVVGTCRLIL